ncbi:hypothetical protein Y032_0145g2500 [Ancylostoma ceylanicum]|uniref:Tc1-like transposase DDE domain-containing protein n=1 Tax=Ancylostoma ceylanicum TaxID=53326 RepID=A0A016T2Y1_9BILA|nr:hypothetical protein Y032_0145g2500 [Ancylostoma ceylanicum]
MTRRSCFLFGGTSVVQSSGSWSQLDLWWTLTCSAANWRKWPESYEVATQKEKKILLLMDNARPDISKKSSEKLKDLGIELVPHPLYSPDLAPSDYHVFRPMQSYFAGKKFKDRA